MEKVAVIGAGPTGLAAAHAALDMGFEVEVIDPWHEITPVTSISVAGPKTKGNLAKKSKFGSSQMYDYPSSLIETPKASDLPISFTLGGLSTVWGANVWFPSCEELGIVDEEGYAAATSSTLRHVPLMGGRPPLLKPPIEISGPVPSTTRMQTKFTMAQNSNPRGDYFGSSILAVDEKKCVKCAQCLTGCSYGAIYSADEGWKDLVQHGKVSLRKGRALKIKASVHVEGKTPTATVSIDSGLNITESTYDRVFVACGAIASTALMQRSSLFPGEVHLKDTQVFYIPLFNFRHGATPKTVFTLAQAFLRGKSKHGGFHLSIYESSADLRTRAMSLTKGFARVIPQSIWNRIIAGIGFIPPDLSGTIKIVFDGKKSRVDLITRRGMKRSIRNALRAHSRTLIRVGILPFSVLVQMPNVGASYHVGSASAGGSLVLNELGQPDSALPIYVVDSSSLPKIPVGPITIATMINANRIVTKVLAKK